MPRRRFDLLMFGWVITIGGVLIYLWWIGPFKPEPLCIVCGRGLFLALGGLSVLLGLGAALATRSKALER